VFDVDTDNLNSKKFFVTGGVLFVICDDFTVKLFNAKVWPMLVERLYAAARVQRA
jgi:hypothetical protein